MFSKSCKYAIRAVLFLASRTDEKTKIGVDEIAKELQVPKHFLAKILQQLTKGRLISSSKGRYGGFYLSENNKSNNLVSVIESFDGPGTFTDCVLGLNICSDVNPCPFHNAIYDCRSKFYSQLQNETVNDTIKRITKNNLKIKNIIL